MKYVEQEHQKNFFQLSLCCLYQDTKKKLVVIKSNLSGNEILHAKL